MTEFSFPITQTIQLLPLFFSACCDWAVFWVKLIDTEDPDPIYGIQAEVFDSQGRTLARSRVHESYVPAAPELVQVLLAPGAAYVRTQIFGPDLDGIWTEAGFDVHIAPAPQLSIQVADGVAKLTWADPCFCWELQRLADGWWISSADRVPVDDRAAFFRLTRRNP